MKDKNTRLTEKRRASDQKGRCTLPIGMEGGREGMHPLIYQNKKKEGGRGDRRRLSGRIQDCKGERPLGCNREKRIGDEGERDQKRKRRTR